MARGQSRLDRLLGLLRTGPSEAARLAAGRQLGVIQREHPEQLHALLQRVLCYLFHEEWETRRAAAHALEEIAEAVTTWQPSHPDAASAEVEAAARDEAAGAWLSFESFAIDRVLLHGAPLLASGGQEFEANDAADDRPHERLLRQRALLQEQLGLDAIGSAIGGREQREMMDLIKEDDVVGAGRAAAASHRAAAADAQQLAAARLITEELAASGGALSERARNTLKRKARRAAKLATDGGADGVVVQLPMAKRARRLEPTAAPTPRATASDGSAGSPSVAAAAADGEGEAAGAACCAAPAAVQAASVDDPAGDAVAAVDDATAWERCDQWPFEPLCAELRCSLFQPRWQRRHGAALGLRAVLRAHAATAGVVGGVSARVRDELRAQWLQDCALRLICVLSLDRFGDWATGDKVVAPVRETAAQALAVLLQPMTAAAAAQVAEALLAMARQPTWEVRHARFGALHGAQHACAHYDALSPHRFVTLPCSVSNTCSLCAPTCCQRSCRRQLKRSEPPSRTTTTTTYVALLPRLSGESRHASARCSRRARWAPCWARSGTCSSSSTSSHPRRRT